MSRYAGTADLYNYLFGTTAGTIMRQGGTITPDQATLLQDCLDRAESAINDYTRRNFAGTGGTVYMNRYTQNQAASQSLYLDRDLHTLVSLTNGDSTNIP